MKYYHNHPRNFANECRAYSAASEEEIAYCEEHLTPITRKQLIAHFHWMNGENESWGSGRAIGDYRFPDSVISVSEFIRDEVEEEK